MKIGIGLSREKDAAKAAAEAVRQAGKTVAAPDLALVFGSIHYDQKKLHAALCREIDPAILIGGSSYAEITNAGAAKGSVAVLLLEEKALKPAFAGISDKTDPCAVGPALAKKLARKPRPAGIQSLGLLLHFTALSSGHENELLRTLSEKLGGMPLFGGLSCGNYDLGINNPKVWINYQYCGPTLTRQGARLAVLDFPKSGFSLSFGFEHGWQPVGPAVKVTRADANRIYEVDGLPVFDYYRQFLGEEHKGNFFEQLVQRYGFSLPAQGGYPKSRLKLPVECNFEKNYIAYFPAENLQGRDVRLIQASRRGLVQGAKDAALKCLESLEGCPPALVLVVSCCTRNAILHSRMDSEVRAIQSVFGENVPVFGWYSGGEIVPFLSRYEEVIDGSRQLSGSHYHASTVGILAVGCKTSVKAAFPRRKDGDGGPAENARLRELLAKSEEILDSTEGFLANLSRKSCRDGERLRRQHEIIHRYTPHNVWRKIGDNVARGEFELADAEVNDCFMFLDVKGFTAYSEEHSSGEVVQVLNGIFAPVTGVIYECGGDVDKFIGDCIFASFKKPADALTAGKRILALMEELKSGGNPFTARIGINGGRAIRANVGAKDRQEYTYIGDAVNLAQRLESNCSPGRLLVSEEIFKEAGVEFARVERREITVKNRKRPVTACECSLL
ncbi:MAG: FIST C-terminal domain-containing protein [Elusimicrobia bacterium]|nr:FIST C-terminal domain-containing protein [Elusimicrobiota bacterium]